MKPVDIAYVRADASLQVTWEDDSVSVFPANYLRAWCPCAECQGHSNVVRHRPVAGAGSELDAMWEVGAYAIGLRWRDGHDNGIYRWDWLLAIAPERPPVGLKRGRFVSGVYAPPELDA